MGNLRFRRGVGLGGVGDLKAARRLERDDAVLLGDFRQGKVEVLSAPCLHRRLGVVGERRYVGLSGEGVAGAGAFGEYAVGLLEVNVLLGGVVVDRVLVPDGLVVVHVPHEHAVSGQVLVPAHLLAVLDEEILVVLGGVDYPGLVGAYGRKGDVLRARDRVGCHPVHGVAFEGGIERRGAAVVVVGAVVEHVPFAGRERRGVSRRVEVGQAHDVGELVDERAAAVGTVVHPFVGACVMAEPHAVEDVGVVVGMAHVEGMGPDGVVGAAGGLA